MSASILAFGIATSISAMQWSFKNLDVARDTTLAAQIIQSEIERIRLMPWNNTSTPPPPTAPADSICELPGSETLNLTTLFASNASISANFTATRTVWSDSSRADVKYITVAVTWKSIDGRTHRRSMKTMYAKNGLYDYYYTIPH